MDCAARTHSVVSTATITSALFSKGSPNSRVFIIKCSSKLDGAPSGWSFFFMFVFLHVYIWIHLHFLVVLSSIQVQCFVELVFFHFRVGIFLFSLGCWIIPHAPKLSVQEWLGNRDAFYILLDQKKWNNYSRPSLNC